MRYKIHGKWKRRHMRKLFKGVKGKCPKCERQMTYVHNRGNSATLDHIEPASRGGPTTKRNLQIMCGACNQKKGSSPSSSEVRASAS